MQIEKVVLFMLEQQGLLAGRLDALGKGKRLFKRNQILQKYLLYEKPIETLEEIY